MAEMSDLARDSLDALPEGQRFRLKSLFDFLNARCFQDKIQKRTKVFWTDIFRGVTLGRCDGDPDRRQVGTILLNERVLRHAPRDCIINVLLHEMIHEYIGNFCAPEEDDHGPQFQDMMKDINRRFKMDVVITYHQPIYKRLIEKIMVHRWKCTKCEYKYKRSVNLKSLPPTILQEHAATGCQGVLGKLNFSQARADIEAFCQASVGEEAAGGQT